MYKKKETAIKSLKQKHEKFKYFGYQTIENATKFASPNFDLFRDDFDIVLLAVTQDGLALKWASDRLKDNEDIAIVAVKDEGYAFNFCSDRLQNDTNFILKAISQNGYAIQFCKDKFQYAKEFVLAAIPTYICAFSSAFEFADDKEVALVAVSNHGASLSNCSDRLKNDKEVVLAAVSNNAYSLKYCSDILKNDKEVVLTAIKNDKTKIEYASPQIQALCQGFDPIEVLTKAIESEKLHTELQQELSLPTTPQTIPKKPNKL